MVAKNRFFNHVSKGVLETWALHEQGVDFSTEALLKRVHDEANKSALENLESMRKAEFELYSKMDTKSND